MDCEKRTISKCEEMSIRRVKLGYVADSPTSVQLVDSIGNQVFDLLPVIQAAETDTSIELRSDIRRIRYYPEEWTRTGGKDGCFYDICIEDIAALIDLNELRNVESTDVIETGATIVYNNTTQQYEMFNLFNALDTINSRLDAIEGDTSIISRIETMERTIEEQNRIIRELTNLVGTFERRLSDIEEAIYNWANDKTTKIPRGTINITSGGAQSNWIIQSRAKDQDEDLNFS